MSTYNQQVSRIVGGSVCHIVDPGSNPGDFFN